MSDDPMASLPTRSEYVKDAIEMFVDEFGYKPPYDDGEDVYTVSNFAEGLITSNGSSDAKWTGQEEWGAIVTEVVRQLR
jgi:hypothetical protein